MIVTKPTKSKILWSRKSKDFLGIKNSVKIQDFRGVQKSLIFDIWNSQNFNGVKF